MINVEDLEQLAEICLATAKTVKEHLAKNGQPQPTFDQSGPIFFPQMSPEAEIARLQLRDASKRLNDLATGADFVGQHAMDCVCDLNAYRYIFRFRIAFSIPDNEAISYTELAEKTGTDMKQLRKFVRQLIQIHVFCEPKPGFVAHTAASKALQHPGVGAWNAYQAYDNVPLMEKQIAAIEKWGHGSEEITHTAANLAYNTDKPVYEVYNENSDVMRRFGQLMTWVSGHEHFSNAHVAAGFDWSVLKNGTVVDVGGNMGHACVDIVKANPQLKCIVQELPNIVAEAQDPEKSVIPVEFQDRITFMDHDFFAEQTVQADAYFMRQIMHCYPDKYCVKILRALIPAMKSGSRIVIMDQVIPPVGAMPPVYERVARDMLLQVQMMANGLDRELEEWEELFAKTDKRLRINNIVKPPGSLMSVIEVVFEDPEQKP